MTKKPNDSGVAGEMREILDDIEVKIVYKVGTKPSISIGTKTAAAKINSWHTTQTLQLIERLKEQSLVLKNDNLPLEDKDKFVKAVSVEAIDNLLREIKGEA